MKKKKVHLSTPWHIHQKWLAAWFEYDVDVTVGEIEDSAGGYALTISVANHAKAAALGAILNKRIDFGTVALTIAVEDTAQETPSEALKIAFAGNRLVKSIETVADPNGVERTFAVCWPDALQVFGDNLADYHRNITSLPADVGAQLFDPGAGVSFCSADLREN